MQWVKGKDWESVVIMFSPDGKDKFTEEYKKWDKYISIRVWSRNQNIVKIIL